MIGAHVAMVVHIIPPSLVFKKCLAFYIKQEAKKFNIKFYKHHKVMHFNMHQRTTTALKLDDIPGSESGLLLDLAGVCFFRIPLLSAS